MRDRGSRWCTQSGRMIRSRGCGSMRRTRRRNCLCCGELFRPDPRNHGRQKYCIKTECRLASKAASQRLAREQPQNQDYFRGPVHVERVRVWRAAHPGYWRSHRRRKPSALQDALAPALCPKLLKNRRIQRILLVLRYKTPWDCKTLC